MSQPSEPDENLTMAQRIRKKLEQEKANRPSLEELLKKLSPEEQEALKKMMQLSQEAAKKVAEELKDKIEKDKADGDG